MEASNQEIQNSGNNYTVKLHQTFLVYSSNKIPCGLCRAEHLQNLFSINYKFPQPLIVKKTPLRNASLLNCKLIAIPTNSFPIPS